MSYTTTYSGSGGGSQAAPRTPLQKTQDARLATARAYREVLETPAGAALLADLDQRFGGSPFDAQSDRLTSYRCGGLAVIAYILEQAAYADDHKEPLQETAL